MKIIIFLTLLLVFSLQMHLSDEHLQKNLLADQKFNVFWNYGDYQVKTILEFSSARVSFKGCNSHSASYKIIGPSNGFKIVSKWATTLIACKVDHDSLISAALSNSVRFAFNKH